MIRVVGSAALIAAMVPTVACAQDASQMDALRAEIAALKAQLATLEAKVTAQTPVVAPSATAVAKAAAPAKPAAAPAIKTAWKGAPEFSDESGWSFKPRGRLHFDTGYISTPGSYARDRNLGFNSRIRRIRLGAEGSMPGGFGYKVEVDFANSALSFGDAFFSWSPKKSPFQVRVGNFETLNGLEQISSSNNVSFLERAAFDDAFLNSRRLGAAVAYQDDSVRAEVGAFAAHGIDSSFDNKGWIGAARAVYAPKVGNGQLHLGLGFQHREFAPNNGGVASTGVNTPSTNQVARYRARPNSQLTDVRFVDTGSFAASRDRIVGVEAAAIFPSWYVAGEAQWLRASAYRPGSRASGLDVFANGNSQVTPASNPGFFGGYFELGWFPTGETRGYSKGAWARTKVLNPLSKGGSGAFQLIARVDHLNLNSAGLQSALTTDFTTGATSLASATTRLGRGGVQTGYLIGANWYPLDYVRVMLNLGRVNVRGGPVAVLVDPTSTASVDQRSYSADVIQTRLQFEF
jgi:phosphate-selective porin OprO and OprP